MAKPTVTFTVPPQQNNYCLLLLLQVLKRSFMLLQYTPKTKKQTNKKNMKTQFYEERGEKSAKIFEECVQHLSMMKTVI